MKYPKLNSLVPAGEHFDESAVNGEGVWLSTGHVASIEAALAEDNSEALSTATKQVTDLTESIATLNASVETTNIEKTALAARVLELEAENARLGGKSSGTGTVLNTTEDPNTEGKKMPSYLDDSAPENQWLDSKMKRKKP